MINPNRPIIHKGKEQYIVAKKFRHIDGQWKKSRDKIKLTALEANRYLIFGFIKRPMETKQNVKKKVLK